MLVKAYAKVNLSLDVVGKRKDGYHLLKMIMQNIDLYDVLKIDEVKTGIHICCNNRYIPCDRRNLVYKAAKLFIDKYNIRLCDLYYFPYNFDRTGCVGCPFNIQIKKELEILGIKHAGE